MISLIPGQLATAEFSLAEAPDDVPTVSAVLRKSAAGVRSLVSGSNPGVLDDTATYTPAGQDYSAYFTVPEDAAYGDTYLLRVSYEIGGVPDSQWVLMGQVDPTGEQLAANATAIAGVQTTANAIKAKTDLIGTADATFRSPVTEDGEIDELIVGDDYTAALSRPLDWSVPASTWGDLTGATVVLGFDGPVSIGPIAGSVLNEGTDTQTIRIELTAANTAVPAGRYSWDVEAKYPSGQRATRITGETTFRRSYVQAP